MNAGPIWVTSAHLVNQITWTTAHTVSTSLREGIGASEPARILQNVFPEIPGWEVLLQKHPSQNVSTHQTHGQISRQDLLSCYSDEADTQMVRLKP